MRLVPYAGRAHDDLARHSGIRRAAYSARSWFVEVWLRGRYLGIAR